MADEVWVGAQSLWWQQHIGGMSMIETYQIALQFLWSLNPATVLYWILATFFFWFIFATLMRLRDKQKRYAKNKWQWWAITVPGYLLLIVGYPYDVLYNLTYGTICFWQFPRRGEWTFTARLQRCVHLATWRGQLARFVCRYLVEPWDADHCGMGRAP